MKKIISKSCALLGFVSCVLMFVYLIGGVVWNTGLALYPVGAGGSNHYSDGFSWWAVRWEAVSVAILLVLSMLFPWIKLYKTLWNDQKVFFGEFNGGNVKVAFKRMGYIALTLFLWILLILVCSGMNTVEVKPGARAGCGHYGDPLWIREQIMVVLAIVYIPYLIVTYYAFMWRKVKASEMYEKLCLWGALAMFVAFIIMVLPSGVILMTLKKPEILVKTLNVRLPETEVVYEKPKVGTSWEYEWWCRFKEPMSELSIKRIESKCGTDGAHWVKLGDTQYKYTRGSYADHYLECIVGIDGCKVICYIDDYDALFLQPFIWVVIWGSWFGLMLLWWMIRVIFDKCI